PPGGPYSPFQDAADLQLKACATCQNLGLNSQGNVNVGGFDPANDWTRLGVWFGVSDPTQLSQDRVGFSSNLSFSPQSPALAALLAGATSRANWSASSPDGGSASYLVGLRGFAEITGSSPSPRSVTQFTAGLDAHCYVSEDGAGNGSSNC